MGDSPAIQRLRLELAARSCDFEARVAHEMLAQFNEQQRLLNEADLIASKRRIQELEADAEQPKSKKPKNQHLPGKLDRSLASFGFTGARTKAAEARFVCSTAAIGVSQPAKHEGLTVGHTKLRV